ncbi:serpin-ZXA-like [Lotus japonicus]|uniref:serpin-ZXA-like n=1 Tax=Lotus japonicus TaxID=34305 RepID=UPI0025904D94|nr:serpin-ZXA-like [Lotus japonicus]
MYIFLPDAKDGLPALIERAASESGFLEGKLPRRKVKVNDFRIPKFRISFTLEASKVLGVVSPFSQGDADFGKMVDSPFNRLYIESMFQKAFIEVNDEGTEAAAAATVSFAMRGDTSPTGIDFVADHHFLFLIREDLTGTILFIGQLLHPLDAT